jgi:hypothetical protein
MLGIVKILSRRVNQVGQKPYMNNSFFSLYLFDDLHTRDVNCWEQSGKIVMAIHLRHVLIDICRLPADDNFRDECGKVKKYLPILNTTA